MARLHVEGGEEAALAADLGRILAAFESLGEVDVSGAQEMTGPVASEAPPARPDEARTGLERSALLARAPEPLDDAFFGVPKTVGGET